MKYKLFISPVLVLSLFTNLAFADCDWSTIKKNADGSYVYSADLNLCVGKLVQQNKVQNQQIADYVKALSMKDLSIKASDARAQLWSDTSSKLEDRLQKVDSLEKKNELLFFGLGVLATGLATFSAAKIAGH